MITLITLHGVGPIRTDDTLSGMPPFQGGAFNHSATTPKTVENVHRAYTTYTDGAYTGPGSGPRNALRTNGLRRKAHSGTTIIRHTLSSHCPLAPCTRKAGARKHLTPHALHVHNPAYLWYRLHGQTYTKRTQRAVVARFTTSPRTQDSAASA